MREDIDIDQYIAVPLPLHLHLVERSGELWEMIIVGTGKVGGVEKVARQTKL